MCSARKKIEKEDVEDPSVLRATSSASAKRSRTQAWCLDNLSMTVTAMLLAAHLKRFDTKQHDRHADRGVRNDRRYVSTWSGIVENGRRGLPFPQVQVELTSIAVMRPTMSAIPKFKFKKKKKVLERLGSSSSIHNATPWLMPILCIVTQDCKDVERLRLDLDPDFEQRRFDVCRRHYDCV